MIRLHRLLFFVALIAIAGCSSGNDGGCDIAGGTGLSTSDWPKFRKDLANTGHIDATVAATQTERWVFPARPDPDDPEAPPDNAFANAVTSPVILADGRILVVAGQQDFPTANRVYLINPDSGEESGSFDIPLTSTASVSPGSTPVISESRIAIMFTDGSVRQFDFEGTFLASLSANGTVTGSLTIDHEGSVYTATTNGVYSTLCASGGLRYLLGIGPTESSAALYEGDPNSLVNDDDVSVIASNDGKVRAFKFFSELLWTFTATSAIRASVVYDSANDYDASNDRVYGVDENGVVFTIRAADGRRCHNLVDVGPPVIASPAFAANTLYVVDTIGVLHALSVAPGCDTGSGLVERWTYASGASVSSSPAVASSPTGEPVIVFGSDDGTIHAVVDQGSTGSALWTHCTKERGAFGRSSVAIGQRDASSPVTVYATTAAGRLYAISAGDGTSMPCSALETDTPTGSAQP